MDITEWDIRAMRSEGSLGEYLRIRCAEARQAAADRRSLVLRYPDIATRLTAPPLAYARPDQWNGSIPPEQYNGVHNDSPLRPALLAIVAEAEKRAGLRPKGDLA